MAQPTAYGMADSLWPGAFGLGPRHMVSYGMADSLWPKAYSTLWPITYGMLHVA